MTNEETAKRLIGEMGGSKLSDNGNLPDPQKSGKPYRKKPVVIYAIRMKEAFVVDTLEGRHNGKAGDYLLRGVRGELYCCDAGIFAETYEEVKS
jgi:hypothetical protein